VTLLTATAVGVYLLVVGGATAAIANAVTACPTWPVCHGAVTLDSPRLLVAWGHRLTAALVGVLVLTTAAVAVTQRSTLRTRVKAALAVAVALFPVQVGVGALVATRGATDPLTNAHLLTGMGIFTGVVLALAWTLEPDDSDAENLLHDPDIAASAEAAADADPEPIGTPLAQRSLVERAKATVFAYFRLMKPRLMWLLCLVAAAGMALAAGPADLTVRIVVLTLGGGVLAIGASGTFNHVLERDKDKRMSRTSDRPVATHQVPIPKAIAFGLALAALSLFVFYQVNLLAAALGLSAILFYSVVYTLLLKPNTVQNTVIGGFAGALPALIGSAAVTGKLGVPGLVLAGVIFLWTPAHFYNLALAYKDDYARGGFPMMPVVRGEAETRKHILWYLAATVFGAVFLWTVIQLHHERTESAAFRAFHASNAYLGALLVAIVVDTLAI
jgi:protoheme IX farnesyltransferase